MHFQGRRNTSNMLRSLKQKQRKMCGRAPTKYIKQKCFVGVRYQNVTKLCPLFARNIGSKRFTWMCQSPPLPYLYISRLALANISLQYKLLGNRSRSMETQSALSYFPK